MIRVVPVARVRASWTRALLAAALTVASTGATRAQEPALAAGGGRRAIVLVTVDSLRLDHLGSYAGGVKTTPRLDALAAAGMRFTRAYTTSASTVPATASVLTGLYPARHGLRHDLGGRLPDGVRTLAETLRGAGWSTAAAVGTIAFASERGLDRGFDRFDAAIKGYRRKITTLIMERRAPDVVEAGLKAVADLPPDRPFFLWLNMHDPHWDYDPPEPQKTEFESAPYDGEVAVVDAAIGTLADRLREIVPDGGVTLIVAGAHGEGLGDHQEVGHGAYLYETTIHVPLIVVPGPTGAAGGATVDAPVSLADLAPTVLEIAGVPSPPGLDGVSLAGLLRPSAPAARGDGGRRKAQGGPDPGRRLFVEAVEPWAGYGWSPLYAVLERDRKIVQGVRLEAFDLAADRAETAALRKPPRWARPLLEFGAPLLGTLDPPEERRKAIDAAVAQITWPWENSPFCAAKDNYPDPRDQERVALNERLFASRIEADRNLLGYSVRRAIEVLETDPANPTALEMMVRLGVRNHWGDMVLDYFEILQCDYPYRGVGYHHLGHFYTWKQDIPKALAMYRIFALAEPDSQEAEYDLACAYTALDQKDEAIDHLRRSFALGGGDVDVVSKDPRLAALRDDPRFQSLLAAPAR